MIRFQDFAPRQLARAGIFRSAEYETFEAAVAAAGEWANQQQVRVINVETVVLPNLWREEGTEDSSVQVFDGHATWHQFVRVWYEAD